MAWEPKTAQPDNAWQPKTAQPEESTQDSQAGKPAEFSPHLNAVERGATERALGIEELINNAGVGKHIGLPDNSLIEEAKKDAQNQGKGTGVSGALGEMVGDPLSWVGGAELKGAQGARALAKAGAKVGALGGATEGGKDLKENLKNTATGTAEGAVAAPLIGAAIPAAGKGVAKGASTLWEGFNARALPVLKETAEGIRNESSADYKTMRDIGANIHPEAFQKLSQDVGKSLNETGLWNKRLHGDTMSVLSDLQKQGKEGLSLESLDQHRRLLSSVINKNRISNPEDAKKAASAIESIDTAVANLKPGDMTNGGKDAVAALSKARATWSKARKFELVSDVIEKADGDPNRMKSLLEGLANHKTKTNSFTPEEKNALREAARTNTPEGLLKMAGKFGIDFGSGRASSKGNILPALELAGAATVHGGGLPGAGAVAAGSAAKYAQKLAARAKTERLLKLIEQGKVNPDEAMGAINDPLALPGAARKQ